MKKDKRKTITIIELLNLIAAGKKVPKKIDYPMCIKPYNFYTYHKEEMEYINDADPKDFLSVPNHHLNDYVYIEEEE